MRLSLILAATVMTAFPASAEVSDIERKRVDACFTAREWNCAFDGLVNMYEGPESRVDCLEYGREACWIDMMAIEVSAIGVAENASAVERREIADRALRVIMSITEENDQAEGEILLSALRYDACRTAKDEACMTESAGLIRLAMAGWSDTGTAVTDLYGMLEEVDVHYPIDLEQVMKEVAGTEKQE